MASPAAAVIGGIACVLVVALVIAVTIAYNRLTSLRNEADAAWAQLDVQLTRRHDLVPHLGEAVLAYLPAAPELDAVATAWREVDDARADRAAAEDRLQQELASLTRLLDTYPELRADGHIAALRAELAVLEDRIAHTRQTVDEAASAYNSALRVPPTNLVAIATGFRSHEQLR